jgi:hypothetical protein
MCSHGAYHTACSNISLLVLRAGPQTRAAAAAAGSPAKQTPQKTPRKSPAKGTAAAATAAGADSDGDDAGNGCIICLVRMAHVWLNVGHAQPTPHFQPTARLAPAPNIAPIIAPAPNMPSAASCALGSQVQDRSGPVRSAVAVCVQ